MSSCQIERDTGRGGGRRRPLASIVPALLVGVLYDRYSQSLLDELIGGRLSVHLTATSKRLEAFLDVRRYQVETLANRPAMLAAAQRGSSAGAARVAEPR